MTRIYKDLEGHEISKDVPRFFSLLPLDVSCKKLELALKTYMGDKITKGEDRVTSVYQKDVITSLPKVLAIQATRMYIDQATGAKGNITSLFKLPLELDVSQEKRQRSYKKILLRAI